MMATNLVFLDGALHKAGIVQRPAAQFHQRENITPLEKLDDQATGAWDEKRTLPEGLNLYLSAAHDVLRHPDDKPTIGLLLCRKKNRIVVEYALRHLKRPIGVAEWETKLVEKLPASLKGSLPTVEEIEAEFAGDLRRKSGKRRRKS